LIDDPHVGRFALTPAVPDLEVRDEDSDWRQVTLDELKKILANDGEPAEVGPKSRRRPKPRSASPSIVSLLRANT
jgi:hypothetical protein